MPYGPHDRPLDAARPHQRPAALRERNGDCLLLPRRTLLTAAGGTAPAPAGARAQADPDKPIRLVVPHAAGGVADQLARALAARLGQALGQAVLVDNRARAGGTLGADPVAKAAANGLVLLPGTDATHATNVFLSKRFPYDPVSFTPIARAAANRIFRVGVMERLGLA